ncbi:MAG: peptidoglycan-associated lipoprotein Pal [bacterium]
MHHILRSVMLGGLILALAACTGKGGEKDTNTDNSSNNSSNSAQTNGVDNNTRPAVHPLDDQDNILSKRVILFDYDKATVKAEYSALLAAHAEYMSSHPSARVTLEGHADERGTREYNLGLGEQRANAVARLLAAQGVSSSQVDTVSYGEERPVSTCHDENCWYQNRRVEIVYNAR